MNPLGRRLELWLRELRAVNLLTVPGDPLAGAVLAAAGARLRPGPVAAAMGAAMALYAAGILDNDLTGLEEDRRLGRSRPLATGELPIGAARRVRAMLFVAGLMLAALGGWRTAALAFVLVGSVLAYHRPRRRHAWMGPLLLGSCRAFSLLMGAVAQTGGPPGPYAMVAAAVWLLLIAALSVAAREEASIPGRPEMIGRLLCAWPLVQATAAILSRGGEAPWIAAALALAASIALGWRRRWPPS